MTRLLRYLRPTASVLATLLVLLTLTALTACHTDEDDYYTTMAVTVAAPEGCTILQMQGTVRLTNLNNKQTYSTSAFSVATATIEVLRGVYSVDIEGTVRYSDKTGTVRTANFRASSSYTEALDHPAAATLDIILL